MLLGTVLESTAEKNHALDEAAFLDGLRNVAVVLAQVFELLKSRWKARWKALGL